MIKFLLGLSTYFLLDRVGKKDRREGRRIPLDLWIEPWVKVRVVGNKVQLIPTRKFKKRIIPEFIERDINEVLEEENANQIKILFYGVKTIAKAVKIWCKQLIEVIKPIISRGAC